MGRWTFPPEIRMKEYDHPAMFPEELPRRLIKLFSYKNDIILDPFNGAGTTTLVAWKNQRRFIGIDNSEQYCKTACQRFEAFIGKNRPENLPKLLFCNDQLRTHKSPFQ
jgi:site-specific DNA-methyltransferase (adenine-specific)